MNVGVCVVVVCVGVAVVAICVTNTVFHRFYGRIGPRRHSAR